jgi:hypothetical protein
MITKFVCLANSYKEGGRCMAGIELDAQNNPVFENEKSKWIRPVCNTKHGEIPTEIVARFKLLDIIEIDIIEKQPQGYQSENVSFDEKSLKICGTFDRNGLPGICNDPNAIFDNWRKSVSDEEIDDLDHSLLLLRLTDFEVVNKIAEDKKDRPQTRLIFSHHGNQYDFPITDPSFLHRHKVKPDLLKDKKQIYVCCSLGILWKDAFYKLVAAIIY